MIVLNFIVNLCKLINCKLKFYLMLIIINKCQAFFFKLIKFKKKEINLIIILIIIFNTISLINY